jgi:phosphoglycerate kinase
MVIPQLSSLDIAGKKVLLRVDFNVPLDINTIIEDDTRIIQALPTINYILEKGGKCIILSHLGRPEGEIVTSLSLLPIARHLETLLKKKVFFATDCVGKEAEEAILNLQCGQVLVLENVRFHKGEEEIEKEPAFLLKLAHLGDIYVNDAFGTSHRKDSSVYRIVPYFKGRCAVGLLMKKEMTLLDQLLNSPKRPFIVLIGGAKISTKILLLKALVSLADALLIGGAMANTFLKAQGVSIGASLYEEEYVKEAQEILALYKEKKVPLILPQDVVIEKGVTVVFPEPIPPSSKILDIGEKTIEEFISYLKDAKTCFWNGPMGVFEEQPFEKGTYAMARALGSLDIKAVVGGGDSIAAVHKSHTNLNSIELSTGGGASLKYLETGTLPALQALLA